MRLFPSSSQYFFCFCFDVFPPSHSGCVTRGRSYCQGPKHIVGRRTLRIRVDAKSGRNRSCPLLIPLCQGLHHQRFSVIKASATQPTHFSAAQYGPSQSFQLEHCLHRRALPVAHNRLQDDTLQPSTSSAVDSRSTKNLDAASTFVRDSTRVDSKLLETANKFNSAHLALRPSTPSLNLLKPSEFVGPVRRLYALLESDRP